MTTDEIKVKALPISPEDAAQGYSWTMHVTTKITPEVEEEFLNYLKGCQLRGMPLYYSYTKSASIGITHPKEPTLKQKVEAVCLQGPKVLNGIAPTQTALDSFLADFGIFPVFPGVTFITRRRIAREAFDAFHFDDPNQFIPQGYIRNPVTDPEMLVVLASGSNVSELTIPLNPAEKTYKRSEVQQWRNDAVSACIDIANRFKVDTRVIAEFKKLIEKPTPVEKKDE